MVVAIEMLNKLHLTIYREPVGMDIQRTHEDAYHQSLVMEIGVLFSLFHHNNLAIGWSHDQLVGIAIEIADRAAIEVKGHHPGSTKDQTKHPEGNFVVDEVPENGCNQRDGQHAQYEFIGAFTVYSNFLEFLYSFSHGLLIVIIHMQRYERIEN